MSIMVVMKVVGVSITLCTILALSRALPLTSTALTGSCAAARQNCSSSHLIGQFCPTCDSNGNYVPEQCSGSTGYCWCVDVISGNQISNTMTPPGTAVLHCGNTSPSTEETPTSTSVCDGCGSERHCPSGWSRFTDHCYMFVNTPKTWTKAEGYCQTDGANLASVHSDKENHFIMSLTQGDAQDFPQAWLGGFDGPHPGVWMWSDGSDFDYSNWAKTKDVGAKKKNCLKINEHDLKWFQASCSKTLPFVCAKSISAPPAH